MVHIDAIDWGSLTLSTDDGLTFVELTDSTWIVSGPVEEGAIRYWGGGCHSGQINLTPLYRLETGEWVNIRTRKAQKSKVFYKGTGLALPGCPA